MQHVVTSPKPPFFGLSAALRVVQVPMWQDNLSWVAVCEKTGECAIVDGPEAGPALAVIEANGWALTTILNTHQHPDHIGLNNDLKRRGLLENLRVYGPRKLAKRIPGLTDPVGDGDTVTFGALTGDVWLTEGHVDGHVTYLFGNVLFCGDTMFGAGCGYLFDGPPTKMHHSLQRLASLPDDTLVCCAHEYTEDNLRFAASVEPGNAALLERIEAVTALRARGECSVPSTIGEEKATNPFVRVKSLPLRKTVAEQMNIRDFADDAAVFAATRALKDTKRYKA